MSKDWEKAQINEKSFWRDLEENTKDKPIITIEQSLRYLFRVLDRFDLKLSDLNEKILCDVGSGPAGVGMGLQYIHESGSSKPKKVISVDPLMDFYKSYKLIEEDSIFMQKAEKGEEISLDSSSIDFVLSTNAVDHVDSPQAVINEMARLVKTDGTCFIAVHVVYPIWSIFSGFLKYIDKNHPHHFTEKKFLKLTNSAFEKTTTCYRAQVFDDNPDFRLFGGRKQQGVTFLRRMQRWLSNFVLYSCYVECHGPKV